MRPLSIDPDSGKCYHKMDGEWKEVIPKDTKEGDEYTDEVGYVWRHGTHT